jgi:hypothetical protein
LAGCEVIDHAKAGLKTITEQGGEILGCCHEALKVIPDERDHTWGYNVIRILAEKRLREGRLTQHCTGPARRNGPRDSNTSRRRAGQ